MPYNIHYYFMLYLNRVSPSFVLGSSGIFSLAFLHPVNQCKFDLSYMLCKGVSRSKNPQHILTWTTWDLSVSAQSYLLFSQLLSGHPTQVSSKVLSTQSKQGRNCDSELCLSYNSIVITLNLIPFLFIPVSCNFIDFNWATPGVNHCKQKGSKKRPKSNILH